MSRTIQRHTRRSQRPRVCKGDTAKQKDGLTSFPMLSVLEIEVTSWLVSADDFSSRVARGANERVSAANE